MNVPLPQFLVHQTLNSKFIEFVWQFPRKLDSPLKDQFICRIELNPMVYLQWGTVNAASDYIDEPGEYKFGYGHLGAEAFLTSEPNWAPKKFPEVYKNFTNGQDLVSLVKEVNEYLQSL